MSREIFIITHFVKHMVVFLSIIFIIYRYAKKGWLVIPLEKMLDCKLKVFMQRGQRYITLTINVLVLISILIIFVGGTIPTIKDIPVVYRGNYSYVIGKVEKNSYLGTKNKMVHHNLYIKDKKSERIINLQVYGIGEIRKGTEVKVEYLPNSLEGRIVEE